VIARSALPADWPGIEVLRDACYERWGIPVQVRDGLSWLVYEHRGRITTAVGYSEPMPGQWTILDWYAEPGRIGIRGGSAILKLLLAEADHQGKTICGVSCMEPFIGVALRRGFKFAGVALVRQPGK
jgi:hypothetical protein